MKKAIVLLSGGIDSSTVLYKAKKNGYRPIALIFDYGQRHRKEIQKAKKIAASAGVPFRVVRLPFPDRGSSLLDSKKPIPRGVPRPDRGKRVPSTYVPARNLVFLSIAASFAEAENIQAVFIGAHAEDYSGYPDCRARFFSDFGRTLKSGTKKGDRIKIITPLLKMNKEQIIRLALRLGVPLGQTWSCYAGGDSPCGRCDSCFFRARAFRRVNMDDPAA